MPWVGEWQGDLRWASRAPGPLTAPAAQMLRLVVGLSESLQHVLSYDGVYLVEVHATPYPYCHQFAGHPYA